MFFKDYRKRINARRAAMHEAEKLNNKRMKTVYESDNEWLENHRDSVSDITAEQREQIECFWSKYSFAYKNDPLVQAHFSAISGKFSPYYLNYGLNAYYMYRYYDDPVYHTAFHNKNYREILFDVPCTPVLARRINNVYYDVNHNKISYNTAIELIHKYLCNSDQRLIVKPNPGGGGNGIVFLDGDSSKINISSTLDGFMNDDLVIEIIQKSHSSYTIANESSLNTLRIVTYFNGNVVKVIATVFRMGSSGSDVDNFTSGGIACGVNDDGTCFDYGYDRKGNVYKKHPNGFEFAGHLLHNVSGAHATVKKLHLRIPQFKQISWDIAINENGAPILVEMNPRGDVDLYQAAGALPYGDATPQVIDDMLFTYFFKNGANKEWNYKEYTDHVVLTEYCWNKRTVKIPEQINGKYITHISAGCFADKDIKKLIIPGCVKDYEDSIRNLQNTEIILLEDKRNISIPCPDTINGKLALGHNSISWDPTDGVTHYLIYRRQNGEPLKFLKKVSALSNGYIDTNILNDVIYHYYVYGYNSKYNLKSELNAHVALRAWCDLQLPDNFEVKSNPGENLITWDAVPGATHYLLYRMEKGKSRILLKKLPADALRFNDTDVDNGNACYYYIRSHNSILNLTSAWSKPVFSCLQIN